MSETELSAPNEMDKELDKILQAFTKAHRERELEKRKVQKIKQKWEEDTIASLKQNGLLL